MYIYLYILNSGTYLSPSKKIGFISFNGRPLQMMNNFYFLIKLFSFSTYFNFCEDFFGHVDLKKA